MALKVRGYGDTALLLIMSFQHSHLEAFHEGLLLSVIIFTHPHLPPPPALPAIAMSFLGKGLANSSELVTYLWSLLVDLQFLHCERQPQWRWLSQNQAQLQYSSHVTQHLTYTFKDPARPQLTAQEPPNEQ